MVYDDDTGGRIFHPAVPPPSRSGDEGGPARGIPELHLVVDLGTRPQLLSVTGYLEALQEVFDAAVVQSREQRGERTGNIQLAYPRQNHLIVSRMQLASPLELLLTHAVDATPAVGYALGGLLILERGLKMVMNWQNHRLDMMERHMSIINSASAEAASMLRQRPIVSVGIINETTRGDDAEQSVGHPDFDILRPELRRDRDSEGPIEF